MVSACRLAPAQPVQGNVDVARRNVDDMQAIGVDRIARDVAGALAMANNSYCRWKFGCHGLHDDDQLAARFMSDGI